MYTSSKPQTSRYDERNSTSTGSSRIKKSAYCWGFHVIGVWEKFVCWKREDTVWIAITYEANCVWHADCLHDRLHKMCSWAQLSCVYSKRLRNTTKFVILGKLLNKTWWAQGMLNMKNSEEIFAGVCWVLDACWGTNHFFVILKRVAVTDNLIRYYWHTKSMPCISPCMVPWFAFLLKPVLFLSLTLVDPGEVFTKTNDEAHPVVRVKLWQHV